MTTQKITKRDNFNELRSLVETSMLSNEDQDRLLAFIDHELELLDKRKASSAKSAKRGNKAQDELASKIADVLTADEAQTIPQILAQIDELESLYRPHGYKSVSLNVSAPRASYISAAFSDFLNRYASEEHLKVNYHETSGAGAINDVAGGESSLGIVRYQNIYDPYFSGLIRENRLRSEPLWEFRLSVLLSESHPLASYKDIPYHLLSQCTEIIHGDVQAPPLSFSKIQKQARLDTPHKTIAVYDRGIQFDLLERVKNTFMWVSPMPEEVLASKRLVLRSCSSVNSIYKDVFVYDPRRPLNRHEASFVEHLRDVVENGNLCGR